jgi:cysteine desulfurase
MYGGSQERGVRAGTENVPGVVGLAVALELALKQRTKETKRLMQLTSYFWKTLSKKVPGVVLNGPAVGENRLPNNLNVIFPGVDGEALVIYLDSLGVACSTGSACTAVSREPSHVLKAIGRSEGEILSSVRFSLGRSTTKKMIDTTVTAITKALKLVTQ